MFLVIGKGMFSKDELMQKLEQWGIMNPLAVVREAAKGGTTCGNYTIMSYK